MRVVKDSDRESAALSVERLSVAELILILVNSSST